MNNFELVQKMHEKFQLVDRQDGPRALSSEECRFRISAMFEELLEYVEACSLELDVHNPWESVKWAIDLALSETRFENEDLEAQFDALLDLAVFTMGTADRQNFPWDEGFRRVMMANLKKELGSNGSKRGGFKRDLVKPQGWKAPDLSDLVSKSLPGIVVLEGADGTGKTTLAEYLEANYNAHVIHRTWSEDLEKVMDDYLLDSVNEAVSVYSEGGLVVIDRSFITEWVYSEVFRNGTKWKGLHRAMCNGLNGLDACFVVCSIEDDPVYKDHYEALMLERNEMYSDVDKMLDINSYFNFINNRNGSLEFIGPNLGIKNLVSYDIFDHKSVEHFAEEFLIPRLKGINYAH